MTAQGAVLFPDLFARWKGRRDGRAHLPWKYRMIRGGPASWI